MSSGQEQQAQKLLSEAIYQEEVNGKLDEAIKTYQLILNKYPDDRKVSAEVLLHLGMCYEKLGNQEAVKTYKRLVSNFPEQKNQVAIARERLSRLIQAAEKVLAVSLAPKFTKIKMPTNPGNGLLSPDGKRIAFIFDGCVWTIPVSGGVDPLIAGEPKKLTDNIGAWDNSNSFAWSGDGKWIAVNAELKSSSTSIYVIPSEGGKPHKVQVPSHRCNWPTEFRLSLSPDGKILAYTTGSKTGDYQTKSTQIYTIPVNGGTPKELTGPGTQEPAFSPDGTKIAYIKYTKTNETVDHSDLWVTPSDGGTPVQVTSLPSLQIFGPSWSPDGKMIAFIRRAGIGDPKEIWIVPVTNKGNPSAEPTKVDLPLASYHEIAGWTSDNKIGFQLMNPEYEIIYTVNSSGGIATQVTPQGWTEYPKWSQDGKKIFFRGARGKIAYVPSGGGAIDSIPIQSEFEMFTAAPGSGNDISPDGKTIVFSGARYFYKDGEKKWDVNIYTIPVEGGKPKQLTTIAAELQDRFPCWSPDGNSIAFIRPEIKNGKQIMHVFTISKEGNKLKQITIESDSVAWAPVDWAPDGKSIAFFSNDNSIRFIAAEGGESRFITEVDSANSQYDLAWSPDGKELAYTDKGKIWIYTNESGKSKEVKTGVTGHATKLGWSPDGKKIAFTAYAGGDNELWLMENFLPLEKLAQKNEKEKAMDSEEIKIRQVWTGNDADNSGSISADGGYLTFTNWTTGNLEIRDLKTNKNNQVTNWGSWKDSVQYVDKSLISPDGKQIAYLWYRDRGDKGIYELRLIKVGNQTPVTLYYCSKNEYVIPEVWFSNGNKIIVQQFNSINNIWQLSSLNITNGELQLLLQKEKVSESSLPLNLSLSPDEKQIAFDFPDSSEKGKYDIFLLSVDSKTEIPIIKHPANDRLLGWLPGSDKLLFTSDRSGTTDVWAVNTSEERKSEETKCILTNIGDIFDPLGFTRDGSLYFGMGTFRNESFIVPFDNNNGKLSKNQRILLSGMVYDICWLPDGESLIITKIIVEPDKTWSNTLYLFNSKTGEVRALADNLKIDGQIRLSPDGKSVLVLGLDKKNIDGKLGIYKVDIASGLPVEIKVRQDVSQSNSVEWDKEGTNIFYTSNDKIIKHNIRSGEEMILYNDKQLLHTILTRSSDGTNLLFDVVVDFDDEGLSLCKLLEIPEAGGEAKTMCSYKSVQNWRFKRFALSPDGKYIYYSSESEITSGDKSTLCRIPSAGGTPEKIWELKDYFIAGISIHPEGKQIAFSASSPGIEIRAIDNLGKKVSEIYSKDK
jgi:Tol biopolymer transport system component